MEKEIIEQALKSWKKIGEVVEFIPYGSGHINDTFRLEVKEDGKEKLYILQRMNKDIFKNQKELMDNIFCSASIPIPSAMWMV